MSPSVLAPAWCRLRAELRQRWRFVVVAGMILGIAAGVALAGAAGARRAGTVVTRMVAATASEDVLVLPESDGATRGLTAADLAALPGVHDTSAYIGFAGMVVGTTDPSLSLMATAGPVLAATPAGMLIRHGRGPDEASPDEVVANEAAAATYGWHVGDLVRLRILPDLNIDNAAQADSDPFAALAKGLTGTLRTFHLVGIGLSLGDAVLPGQQNLVFTRAFYAQTHAGPIYDGFAVHLDTGQAAVPAFEAEVQALVPGEQVAFRTMSSATASERRAIQPEVAALWAFAAVMAAVALALWVQAAARRAREDAADDQVLTALGASAGLRLLVDGGRALAVALIAAAVAATIAWTSSPLLPVGEARRIEPRLGFDPDWVVLVGGAAVIVAAAVALGVLASIRSVGVERRPRAPSAMGRAARAVFPSPAAGIGVAFAVERDGSASRAPARLTLVGAVFGVLATLAVVTFAVNLDHFVRTPASFGWGFDIVVDTGGLGDQGVDDQPLLAALSTDHDVVGWARSVVLQGSVDGRPESLLGIQQGGGHAVGPTLLSGRLPSADDEVTLGAVTARRAGVGIGDTVRIGTADHESTFRVVGTAVLPGLRNNSSDAAALGEGAALTARGLVGTLELDPDAAPPTTLLVELAHGATASAVVARLSATLPASASDGISVTGPTLAPSADGPVTPTEVVAYRSVSATPVVLAAVLALLTALTVGFALVSSVRRHSRELGTLRALGFTGRQVRGVVASQATAVAAAAALIGAPLGVLLGRRVWSIVAEQLGVQPTVVVPWLVLALAVPATIAVTNLVTVVSARRAAGGAAADALRSE